METWQLEVTDLKQYTCCPRIVFYRYCLPKIRPTTYLMEEGIRSHHEEETREERRSLHTYHLTQGERFFHLSLQSERLGLTGRADLVIVTPARDDPGAEAHIVEYKFTEQKAGPHFKLQLAAYALLLEETWGIPVKRTFLYSIVQRKAETVPITQVLRHNVLQTVERIRVMIEREILPPPPPAQQRCVTCEFRRFCNDVI